MCPEWRKAEDDPRAQVEAVIDVLLPRDGWDRMLRLELGRDEDGGLAVRLVSDGPDGVPGTPDDLSTSVKKDGSVDPLRTADERPRTDLQ